MSKVSIAPDWKLAKITDCARIVSGATPSTSEPRYWDGDISWVTPKDVSDLEGRPFLDSTPRKLTAEGLASCSAEILPPRSVLLSSRAPIGLVAINTIPTATNQGFKSFVPDPAVLDAGYLYHWLRASRRFLEGLGTGATFKEVSKAVISRIEIPLPPLDEQKRIAAVLDKADALRRQRQKSLQLTEKLIQSVFIDMFVRNPDVANWTPHSIEWMAKDAKGSIRTGPFGSQLLHSEFVDAGVAVLGIDNAVKNRFEWGEPRYITSKKYESLKRYKVFPGDLIITIMGTLGRCSIVPENIPEAINTKHLCCITLDQQKCLPEFLHAAFLHHPEILRQLGVRSKGAVMPGLNMGIIKELTLPLPPIELQIDFKRIVDLCTASRLELESSQQSANDLFGSIQQRAFRGEIDLSRLILEEDLEALERATDRLHQLVHVTMPKAFEIKRVKPAFVAPPEIESMLKVHDAIIEKRDQFPWSLDYFKYRILATQPAPFRFADLMEKAEAVFEEPPPYEQIKDLLYDLLGQDGKPALLRQRFDLQEVTEKDEAGRETSSFVGNKEMVFELLP